MLVIIPMTPNVHMAEPYCRIILPKHYGVSKNNSAVRGGVIRRSNGLYVLNFISPYDKGSINYARISDLLEGIIYFKDLGIRVYQIQYDTILLINKIDKMAKIPCNLRKWRIILREMANYESSHKHVFGKQLSD